MMMMNSQDAQRDPMLERCTYRSLCMLDPIDYFYFRPGLSSLKCKKIVDSKFREKKPLKERTRKLCEFNVLEWKTIFFFSKKSRTCTIVIKVNWCCVQLWYQIYSMARLTFNSNPYFAVQIWTCCILNPWKESPFAGRIVFGHGTTAAYQKHQDSDKSTKLENVIHVECW